MDERGFRRRKRASRRPLRVRSRALEKLLNSRGLCSRSYHARGRRNTGKLAVPRTGHNALSALTLLRKSSSQQCFRREYKEFEALRLFLLRGSDHDGVSGGLPKLTEDHRTLGVCRPSRAAGFYPPPIFSLCCGGRKVGSRGFDGRDYKASCVDRLSTFLTVRLML
ncbi:hypothetical protein B0J14DRAFT_364497 [Halenospora varia]|nr:hypothetical protein B0J14DRAFT_364497 [Halenospora varia]